MLAIFLRAIAILNLERDRLAVEAPHPLGPAVGNRLRPFDRVDKILAQTLFDDLLLLQFVGRAASESTTAPPHCSAGRLAAKSTLLASVKCLHPVHRHLC